MDDKPAKQAVWGKEGRDGEEAGERAAVMCGVEPPYTARDSRVQATPCLPSLRALRRARCRVTFF